MCAFPSINKYKFLSLKNQGVCVIQGEFILEVVRENPQLFSSREFSF